MPRCSGSSPTPDGWAGGMHWINPATLVGRGNLATALLDPKGPYGDKPDPAAAAARHGHATPETAARFLADLWLQPAPPDGAFESLWNATADGGPDRLRGFARRVASSTAFQLA